MSLFDDDRPVKKTAHEIGSDLSLLSVDELANRIDLLKAEIERRYHFSEILVLPTRGLSSLYANEKGVILSF